MHVPVRVFADSELLAQMRRDHSLGQLVNVSTLPGITRFALGMPDMHEGYGFPVGGVAGTLLPDGAISPGIEFADGGRGTGEVSRGRNRNKESER